MADDRITLDEAATIVGLSRRLLDHRIACGHLTVGADGLAAMSDVLAFKEREHERREALAEIARLTDEHEAALQTAVVVRTPGPMSGDPCFRGTRVRVETLFVSLAAGETLDVILAEYPTLDREDCKRALMQACEMLAAAAPTVDVG